MLEVKDLSKAYKKCTSFKPCQFSFKRRYLCIVRTKWLWKININESALSTIKTNNRKDTME